jgi:hypothetical protein
MPEFSQPMLAAGVRTIPVPQLNCRLRGAGPFRLNGGICPGGSAFIHRSTPVTKGTTFGQVGRDWV